MTTVDQGSLNHDPVLISHDAVPTGDTVPVHMPMVESPIFITHDSLPTRDNVAPPNRVNVEDSEPKKLECGCRAKSTALIVCFDGTSNKFGENVAFTPDIQCHGSEPFFLYSEYERRRNL
jgi:hypothetical protein